MLGKELHKLIFLVVLYLICSLRCGTRYCTICSFCRRRVHRRALGAPQAPTSTCQKTSTSSGRSFSQESPLIALAGPRLAIIGAEVLHIQASSGFSANVPCCSFRCSRQSHQCALLAGRQTHARELFSRLVLSKRWNKMPETCKQLGSH